MKKQSEKTSNRMEENIFNTWSNTYIKAAY